MAGVPFIFGNATTSIPLSNLDADFNTPVTIGNTTVGLGNTVTTLGNVTLNNVTITSGTINASVTEAYSNANAIVYANASKVGTTNANLTYDGTTFTAVNDASISGLTVGKGGGAVSTNTVLGVSALALNSTGAINTAVGYQALNKTIADYNTGIGYQSLFNNTSGSANTAIGDRSLTANTTGSSNTGLGDLALASNTTASNNTAVGYQAGYGGTTASANNVIVGYQAGYSGAGYSTMIGYQAGYSSVEATTGSVFIGYNTGYANTTGYANAALGQRALQSNTTGTSNTSVGHQALQSNTTGSSNTAIGYQAGYNNTGVGAANNFFGSQAGLANTTGQYNIYIGNNAADNLQTGSNGIYIGRGVQASSTSVSQEFVMGVVGATGKGTNTGFISPNGGGVYQGNNSATWSITSDARLKKNIVDNTTGLNAISQIQVRNFEYRTKDEVTELPVSSAIDIKGVQLGAIAQELQAILPDCVKTESTGVMSVDATNLTWYLINAVKELNAKITALENK